MILNYEKFKKNSLRTKYFSTQVIVFFHTGCTVKRVGKLKTCVEKYKNCVEKYNYLCGKIPLSNYTLRCIYCTACTTFFPEYIFISIINYRFSRHTAPLVPVCPGVTKDDRQPGVSACPPSQWTGFAVS